MLNLSVSRQPCHPGKPSPVQGERPTACETCGAPGGAGGALLEEHIVSDKTRRYLCPVCHSCLHLDVAGRRKAGRIIWLPELSQEELNILSLAVFIVVRKAGVHRKHAPTQAMRDHAVRLYKTFEKRAEAIELFLGGGLAHSPLPRHELSTPTYVASLIQRAQLATKLAPKDLAGRLDGLRLLPDPAAFETYIAQVSRLVTANYAVDTWMSRVEAQLQQSASEVAHFDASPAEATF